MSRLRLRYEIVMEDVFAGVVLGESVTELEGKVKALSPAQKAAARKALAPAVKTTSGGVPLPFTEHTPGESNTYEEKLPALTPGMIDHYWDHIAKDRTAAPHSDPDQDAHAPRDRGDRPRSARTRPTTSSAATRQADHPALQAPTSRSRARQRPRPVGGDRVRSDPRTSSPDKQAMRCEGASSSTSSRPTRLGAPLNRAHDAVTDVRPTTTTRRTTRRRRTTRSRPSSTQDGDASRS